MLQLYRNKYELIFNFTIYGERNSGTNFLENCIKEYFGLEITYFYGFKHFFGWSKPETISYRGRHTLFIGIVRSPYEWLLSMYKRPHHVPRYNRMNLKDLLHNEWISVHQDGREMMEDRNFNSDRLNPSRYKNIFELRNTKYKYLSETMPVIASNYVLLSYDHLIRNHNNYLNIISNRFNLKQIGSSPEVRIKPRKIIKDSQIDLIDPCLDWSMEESLGYYKSDMLK